MVVMSKKTKKRNKPYTGENAASKPTVHKYQAVTRSPLGEWWHDNKKRVRLISLITVGSVAFIYLMYEFFKILF